MIGLIEAQKNRISNYRRCGVHGTCKTLIEANQSWSIEVMESMKIQHRLISNAEFEGVGGLLRTAIDNGIINYNLLVKYKKWLDEQLFAISEKADE